MGDGPCWVVGEAGDGELGARTGVGEELGDLTGERMVVGLVAVGMAKMGMGNWGPGEVVGREAWARAGRVADGRIVRPW